METPQQDPIPVFSRLILPWPSRRHPMWQEYQRATEDVLIGIGLISGAPEDRCTQRFLGAVVLDYLVCPYASLDRLVAVGAFHQWLFFVDDQVDDDAHAVRDIPAAHGIMEQYASILESGLLPPDPSPFARFTLFMRRRLLALSPEGLFPRYLKHVREYLFQGTLTAMDWWSRDYVPSLDEFEPARLHDSALFPALDLIEVSANISLPDEVRGHPSLVEMTRLAALHVTYLNDLASYQKEVLWMRSPFNVMCVLMRRMNLSFEQAVQATAAILDESMARFVRLEQDLPRWGAPVDAAVSAYVHGLKCWVRGNLDFSVSSRRYRALDSPFVELRGG